MAINVTFGYFTGKTLTYGAYTETGTVRTAAGTSLPEVGTTGLYSASDANIVALDVVIVKEGTAVRGFGQYKPEVSASGVEAKIDTIDTNVDSISTNVGSVLTAQQQVRSNLGGEDLTNVKIVSNL